MLRRPGDRMQGLAELAALAEALGDARLEIDVRLRRAAAMRTAEEFDRAAELAREVRDLAVERGDREGELAACMELGQDLLRATAGESFAPPRRRSTSTAPMRPFRRAMELARELGDVATPRRPPPASSASWSSAGCARGSSSRSSSASTSRSRSAWRRARSWRTSCPSWRSRRRSWRRSASSQRALELYEAARRPARRDVDDHRDRVPELGGGHPPRRELGPPHRGDPPAHVQA